MLKTILLNRHLCNLLSPYFTPNASPAELVSLYEEVVNTLHTDSGDVIFMLLTKVIRLHWVMFVSQVTFVEIFFFFFFASFGEEFTVLFIIMWSSAVISLNRILLAYCHIKTLRVVNEMFCAEIAGGSKQSHLNVKDLCWILPVALWDFDCSTFYSWMCSSCFPFESLIKYSVLCF